jgi:hypothetical protein
MRSLKTLFLLWLVAGWPGLAVEAASLKLIKVLPQFLDREGRYAVSPSLFDRDAYQVHLRRHPEERSGLRFAVEWRGPRSARPTLRVELRGAQGQEPTTATVEKPVRRHGLFSSWSSLELTGKSYKEFGELAAWRATLWDSGRKVAEQKSFLWE